MSGCRTCDEMVGPCSCYRRPEPALPAAVDAFLASYGRDGVRALMEAFLRQNGWTYGNERWPAWWIDADGEPVTWMGSALDVELARKETA